MRIVVITNDVLKEEMMAQGLEEDALVSWQTELGSPGNIDCCIDLLFINDPSRIEALKNLGSVVMVNDIYRTSGLPPYFIRINGWNSFLKRNLVEATAENETNRAIAEKVFMIFKKRIEWTTDQPGFISARIVAMIINEAFYALEEKISTREEIDLAMKLGTNYPYGPFEWSNLIGLKNVYELLLQLSQSNPGYQPAPLLKNEALAI